MSVQDSIDEVSWWEVIRRLGKKNERCVSIGPCVGVSVNISSVIDLMTNIISEFIKIGSLFSSYLSSK